ncbi:uncharacterized protein [Temnothorax nylanderi]|uniref:uncharacterized protein n=1 Tax=Temnothorax nylanderi TaxID=102681 RepID=UPI003A878A2D
MANHGDAEHETKRIAVIRDETEGMNTMSWIEIIRAAQANEESLRERERTDPDNVYEREGMIRIKCLGDDRIALPRKIAWKITRKAHKLLIHFGTDKVHDFLKRYFDGANFARIARDVVASCEICQATKYYTRATVGSEYYDLPEAPGDTLSMDIFGPLPVTNQGHKYVLVLMDQFSKYVKLYPMRDQRLDTIIEMLESRFFAEIGIPETILTDNGGQFLTDRWREYARDKGFSVRRTSPYNLQSNPVEKVMREIGRIIRTYASQRQRAWSRILDRAEEVINHTTHSSHGYAPCELNDGETGHLPTIDPALIPLVNDGEEQEWADKVQEARERVAEAARKRKIQADKHGTAEYREGQEIWIKLHRRSDASRKLTKKIHLVFEEPYRVQRIIRPNAYLAEDLDGQTMGVFNARQLKPNRIARLRGDESDDNDHEDQEDDDNRNDEDVEDVSDAESVDSMIDEDKGEEEDRRSDRDTRQEADNDRESTDDESEAIDERYDNRPDDEIDAADAEEADADVESNEEEETDANRHDRPTNRDRRRDDVIEIHSSSDENDEDREDERPEDVVEIRDSSNDNRGEGIIDEAEPWRVVVRRLLESTDDERDAAARRGGEDNNVIEIFDTSGEEIDIHDPLDHTEVANALVALSVRYTGKTSAQPFRRVIDVDGDEVRMTGRPADNGSETNVDGNNNDNNEMILGDPEPPIKPSSQLSTDSVGIQCDLPYFVGFTERDPAIYARTKFRPERLDQYGMEKPDLSPERNPLSANQANVAAERAWTHVRQPTPEPGPSDVGPDDSVYNDAEAREESRDTLTFREEEFSDDDGDDNDGDGNAQNDDVDSSRICVRYQRQQSTWFTIQGTRERRAAKIAKRRTKTLYE